MIRALLMAVASVGAMVAVAEILRWASAWRGWPRRRGLDPHDYDVSTLAAHRARRATTTARADQPTEAA